MLSNGVDIDIDKNMVVKSNDLIEGHYRMSVNAQKLAASIISLVDPKQGQKDNGSALPVFNFTMPELAKILEIDRDNARKRLKSAMKELKNIQIEVRKPDDPGSFILLSLFRTCGFLDREGVARFEFEDRLRSYVRYLAGNFTQYQLVQIKKLRSSYSLRLYEILRKAHPLKCTRDMSIIPYDLGELRSMLGVEKSAYRQYTQFRRSVLERIQAEIEEKTDISFNFESVRKGRKVQAIKFYVRHNNDFEAPEATIDVLGGNTLPENYNEAVASILSSAVPELPEEVIIMLSSELDAVEASQAFLSYSKAKQKNGVDDPAAYFLKILENSRSKSNQEGSARPHQSSLEKLTDDSWAKGESVDSWPWLSGEQD